MLIVPDVLDYTEQVGPTLETTTPPVASPGGTNTGDTVANIVGGVVAALIATVLIIAIAIVVVIYLRGRKVAFKPNQR